MYNSSLWKMFYCDFSTTACCGVKVVRDNCQASWYEARTTDEFIWPLGGKRDSSYPKPLFTSSFHCSWVMTYVPAANSGSSFSRQTAVGWILSVLCVSVVNNRTCGRKTLTVCWSSRRHYLAFGLAMKWGELLLASSVLTYFTAQSIK